MQIKTNDPRACGKRIKTARLLAGLSRKEIEEKFFISASTLQAWEIGKNPLNEKNAKKLIDIFKSVALICSSEWLLFGIGTPPQTFSELQQAHKLQDKGEIITWDDEISIQKEIVFFSNVNKDVAIVIVTDDGMEPFYSPGDYVGGKKRFSGHINSTIGMNCIVQLKDQSIYIRKINKCQKIGLFNLFCNNPKTQVPEPVIFGVDLIFAAPIIWHRKNESLI
jgi:transcriptional regulator with XRE-family HTH domain